MKVLEQASIDNPAAVAFITKLVDTRTYLKAIQAAANEHFDLSPDDVTWGNVGDIERVNALLKEIVEMCNL
jgi:hypothetical protein